MAAIEFRGCRKGALTEAQIRALAFSAFQKPLAASNREIRQSIGLRGVSLVLVRRSLENRGLVDAHGVATEHGFRALTQYRPAHVVAA
jgi:hypothetical protein